jgi:hypothetical protein
MTVVMYPSGRAVTPPDRANTLAASHGNQLIRLFHVEPPDGFGNGPIDVGRLHGAEPFFGRRRTHDVDVPLRIRGHGADT